MMRTWTLPAAACVALAIAALTAGGDPFARLAQRAGLPSAVDHLTDDPALRGVAQSRVGNHEQAAALFTEAGPGQTYNRATAHALTGEYAEALLSYDDLLARDPDHLDARANFMLLASIYGGTKLDLTFMDIDPEKRDGPVIKGPDAQAGARAIGSGSETDGKSNDIFAPTVKTTQGLRVIPKVFDDMFIAASEEWLTTMLDQPGKFLTARLRAEHKRRLKLGTGLPDEEGAW